MHGELLKEVERKLARGDKGRRALMRQLMEATLRKTEEQEAVHRYVKGYQEYPQTEEEYGWQGELAREGLSELPWR